MDLGQVYARYGGWIRAQVLRYLPDHGEDGVQEVLVKLQPALGRMQKSNEEALRALVSRTVRSVCIDELRRRARQPAAEALGEREALAAPEPAAEEEALDAGLRRAWGELGERERQILVLRFRDGLAFREIAEWLDVPQGSVAGWYSRAIDKLRRVSHGSR